MANRKTIATAKWESSNAVRMGQLKLNLKTDGDIIEKLKSVESVQGYIKQAIRHEIEREAAQAAERK